MMAAMADGDQAAALIILAAAWKQISYNFLFFLAGLQSIPKSLIEAAAIDGAGPWRRFWSIVFPLLSPVTFFLLVINIVYAFFETFGVIDATTQGGPAGTDVFLYKIADSLGATSIGTVTMTTTRALRPRCRRTSRRAIRRATAQLERHAAYRLGS